MEVSKQRKKAIQIEQKRAYKLYKNGYSMREIGKMVRKSHTWVWGAVHSLSTARLDR